MDRTTPEAALRGRPVDGVETYQGRRPTEPPIPVRAASLGDAPAMLDVMFSTAMSRESSWWKNTVSSVEEHLREGGGFVAEDAGEILGCVQWVLEDGVLWLRGLAVRPSHEGRGIGASLVNEVETLAGTLGPHRVMLAVSQSNLEVCDFYRRLGYVESSEPYPHAAPGRPAPVVFGKGAEGAPGHP